MCHQTVSLVARHLESAGIPTVIIGSGRDIVEECGAARFMFVDFPLGNPCGKPWDTAMQRSVIDESLTLMERAWQPRTTIQSPVIWSQEDDATWRERFMRVDESNRDALAKAGRDRQAAQAAVKTAAAAE